MNAHLRGPSAADLAAMIDVDTDHRTITVRGETLALDGDNPGRGLTAWLYATLHAGSPGAIATTALLPDEAFEREIREALTDPGVQVAIDPARIAVSAPVGEVAELHRVRVLFDEADITEVDGRRYARVSSLRPNLTPGFFMFVHDAAQAATPTAEVHRHYVRFEDPRAALAFWAPTLDLLVAAGLSFRSKILSRPGSFPRNDSVVFYSSTDVDRVEGIIAGEMATLAMTPTGSPLCAQVAPGLYRAADPLRLQGREESFGQSRCAAVAAAIVATLTRAGAFQDHLEEALAGAGILIEDVSRNASRPHAAQVAA
ncbi:hypothetical protein ET495_04085 [Xylanimonas allomyrinae]|uniref:Uncharacterized protein n=1 Tax=Xylanimonas allomyrinae TaxID=2509459 RepID=A0A4V0YE08_9MICO|nr:T3SS effector HopA1 family protein [Xylanimonas allomyrinae]QAY62561.1 hypothetical protein ET495_04085 [Xylanimonas allomyrinae]